MYSKFINTFLKGDMTPRQKFFNITCFGQAFAAIVFLIFSCVFFTNAKCIYISLFMLVFSPLMAFCATFFDKHYEAINFISQLILGTYAYPMLFFNGGNLRSGYIVLLAISIVHILFLVDGLKGVFLAIFEGIFYSCACCYAYLFPELLPSLGSPVKYYTSIITVTILGSLYLAWTARIAFYVFQTEYENTDSLVQRMSDISIRDTLTGAYKRSYGISYLNNEIKRMWRSKEKLCLIVAELSNVAEVKEIGTYYSADDLLTKAFLACKTSFEAPVTIARLDKYRFFIIYPNCPSDDEADRLITTAKFAFDKIIEESGIECSSSLNFGKAFCKFGMNSEPLIESAIHNLKTNEEG